MAAYVVSSYRCHKESLAQVFSCEFCGISKKAFFTEHLRTSASDPSENVKC